MNTGQTLTIKSTSLKDTMEIARHMGHKLKGGEVIELVSDLGGGKTTFVKGLAAGMGSQDMVHSPTFTLQHEYKQGELTLHHFDFYRLGEAGVMKDELAEVLGDPQAVLAIEWSEPVRQVLPAERVTIKIISTGENTRSLTIKYPKQLHYLLAELEREQC